MFKKDYEYYSFFSKRNWTRRYQFLKRILKLQTKEEYETELLWLQSDENMREIERLFKIGGVYHFISWLKYGFLYKLGLHKSLIESIRDGLRSDDGKTSVDLIHEMRDEQYECDYDDSEY